MPASTRRVPVRLPARPAHAYEVVIGHGCLPGECERLGKDAGGSWVAILDEAVAEAHGARVLTAVECGGGTVTALEVAGGEASKNRDSVLRLQDEAIASGLGRDGRILAIGGGVIGDLAGFVAATLYRGIPYVQVPTTLLAMVDSSVGGKTGVDTPAGKNLVGAFHQPEGVIADVAVLDTLPDAELASGLAEVIKYGIIMDEQLFVDLEDGLLESCTARVPDALTAVVGRCVRLKAEVVAVDETESGRRRILNFGHTVGHALEAAADYGLRHGEAVALGMVAEARLAVDRTGAPAGLPQRIRELCARAGLPSTLPPGLAAGAVVSAARHDKKNRAGEIHCALPRDVGRMASEGGGWSVAVGEQELADALASIADGGATEG